MKTKLVNELPKCDFPHPDDRDAIYDAPTRSGSWAYMCEDCAKSMSNEASLNIGFKFELREKVQADVEIPKARVWAIEPGLDDLDYWENSMMEGIREPECPTCGEVRRMEPDATQFTCSGCGTKCRMVDGLC